MARRAGEMPAKAPAPARCLSFPIAHHCRPPGLCVHNKTRAQRPRAVSNIADGDSQHLCRECGSVSIVGRAMRQQAHRDEVADYTSTRLVSSIFLCIQIPREPCLCNDHFCFMIEPKSRGL